MTFLTFIDFRANVNYYALPRWGSIFSNSITGKPLRFAPVLPYPLTLTLGDVSDAWGHLSVSSSLLGSSGIRADQSRVGGAWTVTSLVFNKRRD
jgi:hypothetical protein